MKSFLDFAKQKENDELKRQVDHLKNMSDEHDMKAQQALMMGDRDGHALHMAKCDHFKSQHETLKSKMNEGVEQIDEISKEKLLKYKDKAGMATKAPQVGVDFKATDLPPSHPQSPESVYQKKLPKRQAGIARAKDRLNKEEVEQINELTTDTVHSYYKKAFAQKYAHKLGTGEKPSKDTLRKRNQGMARASKRFADRNPTKGAGTPASAGDWYKQGRYMGDSVEVDSENQLNEKSAAWQRKEGKSEAGGLNRKGIASYRRENPGSKLSMAVTTKPSKLKPGSKAANRRKSFCARMGGMKKRLTSAKTARDPDSRINKALRKWNC